MEYVVATDNEDSEAVGKLGVPSSLNGVYVDRHSPRRLTSVNDLNDWIMSRNYGLKGWKCQIVVGPWRLRSLKTRPKSTEMFNYQAIDRLMAVMIRKVQINRQFYKRRDSYEACILSQSPRLDHSGRKVSQEAPKGRGRGQKSRKIAG